MAHILIIDDDDDLRLLIKTLLETNGHRVDESSSGIDGVEQFLKNPTDLLDFGALVGQSML